MGALWPEQEKERSSFKHRMMFWHGRPKETTENYNNADSWLRQQHVTNSEAHGGGGAAAAAQRSRRSDSDDIGDDAIMADVEAGQTTSDELATNQQETGTSRPGATSNTYTEETRYMENLRPLPLVCRRTGMSPSI